MRDECNGCLFNGKSHVCASYDLRWAVYKLKIDLKNAFSQFPWKNPEQPEPCYLRELEEHNENA